jgi:hypothetical protein
VLFDQKAKGYYLPFAHICTRLTYDADLSPSFAQYSPYSPTSPSSPLIEAEKLVHSYDQRSPDAKMATLDEKHQNRPGHKISLCKDYIQVPPIVSKNPISLLALKTPILSLHPEYHSVIPIFPNRNIPSPIESTYHKDHVHHISTSFHGNRYKLLLSGMISNLYPDGGSEHGGVVYRFEKMSGHRRGI